MLLFTCEGPRSFDARDVMHLYKGESLGRYVQVTAVLANGDEVSGLMHAEALANLQRQARGVSRRSGVTTWSSPWCRATARASTW